MHRLKGRHGFALFSGPEWFLEKFVTNTEIVSYPDSSSISLSMRQALGTGVFGALVPFIMKHSHAKTVSSSQQIFLKK